MVASNPSNTNIGGMIDIIREFPVEEYVDNADSSNPEPYYSSIHSLINEKNISYKKVHAGDTLFLDPNAVVTVLNPPPTQSNSFDRNSIVIRVTYQNISALFMSDISKDEMKIIDLAGRNTILKVGYYGNSFTCSKEFLERVRPEVSVIEVLEAPSYNIPSKETIARLEQSGSKVYRTDRNGTIVVSMDGEHYTVSTEL